MRTMGRHRQPQANGRHPAASQWARIYIIRIITEHMMKWIPLRWRYAAEWPKKFIANQWRETLTPLREHNPWSPHCINRFPDRCLHRLPLEQIIHCLWCILCVSGCRRSHQSGNDLYNEIGKFLNSDSALMDGIWPLTRKLCSKYI